MALLKKRPTGIAVIAVLWTLGAIYNIYQGLNGVVIDLRALPYLSDPGMPEWFRFGIPAEIMIAFVVFAFGFLTLLVVYGLWTARSWSYDFARAIPIFIIILNSAYMLLYLSAPSELGLAEAGTGVLPTLVGNIILLVIVWAYLPQPHVKQYFGKIPTPPPTPVPIPVPPSDSALPVPPPPDLVATTDGKKFCRYCGVENKTDAVFCDKCGRKIE